MSDLDWRQRSACADMDGELFFPIGDGPAAQSQAREAKEVCADCPVRSQCLEWSLRNGPMDGIWGGLTRGERDNLRQKRRRYAQRSRAA